MFISKSMQVFITLYRHKNLKQAADQLCLTVPPVSRMLKNTEEWLGVKLFVIERNKATPTPEAETLYKKLVPHYALLNEILNENKKHIFTISSSFTYSNFFGSVMEAFLKEMTLLPVIKFSETIYSEDDIFMSFCQVESTGDFVLHHFVLPCFLCCIPRSLSKWKELDLIVEHALLATDEFQGIMLTLRNEGFTGKVTQVDNTFLQMQRFNMGECIMLNTELVHPATETILPFTFSLSLYVYFNHIRRMTNAEAMIDYIAHEFEN
ncbi:LysR family transcriptional regulator [Erwinia oleae]|uniref:LysR family transcriptional regulator n=1 Tax=Erwinia oleae TaxID=796334 RepID=UPI00068C4F20|nr:LysR family transcriptional regulator [Erwinia oleae]